MFVPFFTVDSELTALGKLKILFLVKKLKNIDTLLFIFFLLPFLVNLAWFVCIKGNNSIVSLFSPVCRLFNYEYKGWGINVFNVCAFVQLLIILLLAVVRFLMGRRLYLKMKGFEEKHRGFRWSRKSKFWIMIFVPGITFSVYKLILRLTDFEAMHKYNL